LSRERWGRVRFHQEAFEMR